MALSRKRSKTDKLSMQKEVHPAFTALFVA